jgi:SAM-dependent methyltransferase
VAASDISEDMVASVAAAAASRGLTGDFRRMDAEALEHPDAGFDAVLCALGLMYVAEPLNALREMRRVLRPGGRAAATVWGARRNCGWAEIFPIVESRTASDVCPMFFALGTGSAMADAFRAAGFAEVREERISVPIVFPNTDAAIGAAFIGGPVALAHSRFDDATRDSAYAEYLGIDRDVPAGRGVSRARRIRRSRRPGVSRDRRYAAVCFGHETAASESTKIHPDCLTGRRELIDRRTLGAGGDDRRTVTELHGLSPDR